MARHSTPTCAYKATYSLSVIPQLGLGQRTVLHTTMANVLPTRKVGQTDVTALGYGAMGISSYYGTAPPDEERYKVISISHKSHASRATFT